MSTAEKTKEERLREGLTILAKLKEVGISSLDTGFMEIQGLISEWVKTGEPVQTKVPIPRHERVAELFLPRRKQHTATLALKVLS